MKPYSDVKTITDLFISVLVYFGHWSKSRKLGPNTPNHEHGYTGIHQKCYTPHFTSIEALLECKTYLRIEFQLFWGIWGIRALWGNGAQIEP